MKRWEISRGPKGQAKGDHMEKTVGFKMETYLYFLFTTVVTLSDTSIYFMSGSQPWCLTWQVMVGPRN